MSDHIAAHQAETADILVRLDRAHLMGCSDPSDPTKRTLYSEGADEIRSLRERLAAVEYVLGEFEKAAEAAPHHAYAGPWLAMVDDVRRVAFPPGIPAGGDRDA